MDPNDQVAGFSVNNIPILTYHTKEGVTVITFGDQKNIGIEMYSRDPWGIVSVAGRIGLPTDQLELMLEHPDRFDKRSDRT